MNCPKKKFSPQEDALLIKLVEKHGACKWDTIALSMNGRKGRQCRDRYMNYLNPAVKRDEWTLEEDILLTEKVKEHGPKWAKISKFFEGRTGPALKNRWNYKLSRIENKNFQPILSNEQRNGEDESEIFRSPLNTNIEIKYPNLGNGRSKRPKSTHNLPNNYTSSAFDFFKKQDKKEKNIPIFKMPTNNIKSETKMEKFNKMNNEPQNFVNDTVIEEIFGHISREDELGLIFDCYDCLLGRENLASYFEA
ncbi:hypothetical protein M9Y10_045346 [Tritrichomonas musculus]|uniref:Myb-like DNA-binding domain containing protein n=1 Tax=Tritrichomonas musculus TaxID=1915356 RepID=A0ABR2JV09_9EUKA